MRPTLYKDLMETLEAAENNGYDIVHEMSPEEVLEDMYENIDEKFMRRFDEVPEAEILTAIEGWQKRQEEE